MQILPFLLLRRTRLILTAGISLLIVIIALFFTSANGIRDVGVLWHHVCGCPPNPSDTILLLCTPLLINFIAAFCLGLSNISAVSPSFKGEALYFLTRPTQRAHILSTPLLTATAFLLLLPLFAWSILLAWLTLVHAPALHHLADLIQLIPAVTTLGPHPSLLQIALVPQLLQLYLASVSVGLCAYILFASQRWLLLAPAPSVRILAAFIPLIFTLLPLFNLLFGRRVIAWFFLLPGRAPTYAPPLAAAILAHFVFAAAWYAFTLHTIRKLEL